MQSGGNGWTDERVATLKKLWLDGLSATQIAKHLGGVGRNAVIGKVHRLGLGGGDKVRRSPSPPVARSVSPPAPPRPKPSGRAPVRLVAAEPAPPPPAPGEPKAIRFMKSGECRWPVATVSGEHRFCGKSADRSYCAEHLALSVQKPKAKPAAKSYGSPSRRWGFS